MELKIKKLKSFERGDLNIEVSTITQTGNNIYIFSAFAIRETGSLLSLAYREKDYPTAKRKFISRMREWNF